MTFVLLKLSLCLVAGLVVGGSVYAVWTLVELRRQAAVDDKASPAAEPNIPSGPAK